MRARDPELNSNWGTICTPVEMLAPDGKHRKITASDLKGIFRIIQWHRSGIHEPKDFAILTNVLTKAWSGMTTGEYKRHKGLTKQNLKMYNSQGYMNHTQVRAQRFQTPLRSWRVNKRQLRLRDYKRQLRQHRHLFSTSGRMAAGTWTP